VALLSVGAGIFTFRVVKEPDRHTHFDSEGTTSNGFRTFLPFLIVSTLLMCNLSAVQQASGFYFQDKFGLDAATTAQRVGLALMASALASVLAQLIIVRRLGWPPRRLLKTGAPIAFLGIFVLFMGTEYWMLVAAMGCFGLGQGLMMPGNTAALSLVAGHHEQGRAAGVNTSAQGFGFVLGPMIGSSLYTVHPSLPYATCLGLLAVLTVFVYFVVPYRDPGDQF